VPTDPPPIELTADCSRCAGLCCVLLPYRAVDGFGTDKPGGTPCSNLLADHRCGIHDRLDETGWAGCTAYDCQGAGQHVTRVTYAGRDWRSGEVNLGEMAAVFSVMRVLHGRLAELAPGSVEYAELAEAAGGSPDDLLLLDLDEVQGGGSTKPPR
jgi:hypothetical protein